jgi:oligopeptide/dipeptide ABC transporter ATP-binding protein
MEKSNTPLIRIRSLSKSFVQEADILDYIARKKPAVLYAVSDISFDIYKGETLGLVGESGCGKSTLGRCLLRLYEPDSGQIIFQGEDILKHDKNAQKKLYSKMQIVFQDPYSSLNPRMSVYQMLAEAMKVHKICDYNWEIEKKVDEILVKVGLAKRLKKQLPYAFSGGQRQRISIARALAVNPIFLVADEPTSALDVSIQAQILNLLMDLQEDLNLTYLFISHDLNVVRHISHRIAVMYMGVIVELAGTESLFTKPLHPYTKALLSAIPRTNTKKKSLKEAISGDPPSPFDQKAGCRFQSRCAHKMDRCSQKEPHFFEPERGHLVRCFKY